MHSVWLMPEAAFAQRFREVISGLAGAYDLPSFEPHATILGSLDLPLAQLLQVAETVAQTGKVSTEVWAVTGREDFFTSLTLDLGRAAIHDLHAQVCASLGMADTPRFQPHLSLAYGMPSSAGKIAEIKKLSTEFLLQPVVFDRLEVVLSSKTVPIEAWRCIKSLGLGS